MELRNEGMSRVEFRRLKYNGVTYNDLEVSTDGQLRNIKTGTLYRLHIGATGYLGVCVSLGSRKDKRLFKIHKCVAESFIDRPEGLSIVNHIDGNKLNNCVDNLEWCTPSENTRHAVKAGLKVASKGEDCYISKFTNVEANEIRRVYTPHDKENGLRALGRKYGVSHRTIYGIVHDKTYLTG